MRRPHDRKPSDNQLGVMREHLHSLVDRVIDAYPQIKGQSQMGGHFPSSSLGLMGGGSGDPVGQAVTEPRFDPAEPANDWLTEVDEFYSLAKSVANKAAKMLPPISTDKGEPGCRVHGECEIYEPVHRGVRCRWCYDFWLAEGLDPPASLVLARAEGRRITDRMVREALGRKVG